MKIAEVHQLFLESTAACTDTRKINPGCMFFALKGDNFNGNTYANKAINMGAKYAIIDEPKYAIGNTFILVDDVLKTLQSLATYHRNYLEIPIIALTGSNGKTTSKELINQVLSQKFTTTATIGNLNNHIGVPLTLLSMSKKTEIGIVEMGANHLEEINFLCNIAHPNYGYITNIGKAHLEGFGSIEGVLKAKTELYSYIETKDGTVFLNLDDPKLVKAASAIKQYTFSQQLNSDLRVLFKKVDPLVCLSFNGIEIRSQLIGAYNFTNIAAAIAIGKYFKIDNDSIKNAIESYIPKNNRSQIIKKDGTTIILDAYNANPTSMNAAISNLDQLDNETKVAFLGDMFELGNSAHQEHQKISDVITKTNTKKIYLIGENFFSTSNDDPRIEKFKTFEELAKKIKENPPSGTILIKGSRGMKLERILDIIQ